MGESQDWRANGNGGKKPEQGIKRDVKWKKPENEEVKKAGRRRKGKRNEKP